MDAGRLIARTVIGGLFVGHGTQKLFGWWSGPGLEDTTKMMDSLEMKPGRRHALASGLSEAVGGALLVTGAFTPVAATLLNGVMFTAIRKVHLAKGLWNSGGGYEFNATVIAATTALVESGPGSPSVDRAIGLRASGSRWALASLAAAAAGSAAAIESGARAGQDEDEVPRTARFTREPQQAEQTVNP